MTDDLLDRATRALRAATRPSSDGLEATIARLPRRSSAVLRLRRRSPAVLWGIAASFVGMGAWAGVTGRVPALIGTLFGSPEAPDALGLSVTAVEKKPVQRITAPPTWIRSERKEATGTPGELPVPSPEPVPSASSPARVAPQVRPGEPRTSAAPRAAALSGDPAASASPPALQTANPNLEALYRDAHQAHFAERDFTRSLSLWDRYIAAAGSHGKMILEARYNRAIALAQIGRTTQAIDALHPFAEGRYGAYRREEARRLIETLSARR